MTAQALIWWAGRSPRERVLLGVMAALLAAVLVWLIFVAFANARDRAVLRLDTAVTDMGRINAAAAVIRRAQRAGPAPAAGTAVMIIGAAASQTGLALSRIDPQGNDRVGIAIANASSKAVFGWIAGLERRGYLVDRLTIRTNSDATIAVEGVIRPRAS